MQPLVLFDLDNTLVDRRLTLASWAATFRAHCGLGLEDEGWVIERLSERASPAHFEGIRTRFGLAESAETLWEGYCADIAAAVVCPAEALVGLERLRALGWRIGIVTNGAASVQWAKLRSTGIADRVDAICISEEVGARKPEPAVFLEAIWRCGGQTRAVKRGWWVTTRSRTSKAAAPPAFVRYGSAVPSLGRRSCPNPIITPPMSARLSSC